MEKKIDYYNMLLDLIPKRKQFKSFAGSEGIAYFISSKYVLKEYTKSDDWNEFNRVFDLYCAELQAHVDSGKNIARVYAWGRIPNMGKYLKGDKNAYQYFILEERVPGRELYIGYLEDAFSIVSDLCSEEEFRKALTNDGSKSLYETIVRRYISDYIEMNQFLESLSDDQLTKFVEDAYLMYKNGKASYPDLFPHNILVNEKTSMKMIDLHMKTSDSILTPEKVDSSFIRELCGLFLYNCLSNKPGDYFIDRKYDYLQFDGLSRQNTVLSKKIISKIFALSNLICERPEVNKRDLAVIEDSLSMMFDDCDVREIEDGLRLE